MKERVVVFGDAIIAIILTIIVLELPIQYGSTGTVDIHSLFSAVGIYFISFCFVANLWFQTAYAFNRIEQVKNKNLVIYLLLLFFLSLVPSATRLLIEDTIQQTILIYGVLTLIVTLIMRRLIVTLTEQAISDEKSRKRRVTELNRQDMVAIGFRIALLVFGHFYVRAALIIYLILPILAFLQNIVDREEDDLVASLDTEQQADYFQDRNKLWGNTMNRYSRLLRDSMKANSSENPDRWKQIMDEWGQQIQQEVEERQKNLSKLSGPEQHRVELEISRLQQQQQKLAKQKEMTEKRMQLRNEKR
ncbi:TMEM175 family protein [Enterococcus devriesei]|uniref:TMEM175 family protein n=1 Tax=Enterococcus devriesei TaxID=319970 RepID=UPI0036D3B4B4